MSNIIFKATHCTLTSKMVIDFQYGESSNYTTIEVIRAIYESNETAAEFMQAASEAHTALLPELYIRKAESIMDNVSGAITEQVLIQLGVPTVLQGSGNNIVTGLVWMMLKDPRIAEAIMAAVEEEECKCPHCRPDLPENQKFQQALSKLAALTLKSTAQITRMFVILDRKGFRDNLLEDALPHKKHELKLLLDAWVTTSLYERDTTEGKAIIGFHQAILQDPVTTDAQGLASFFKAAGISMDALLDVHNELVRSGVSAAQAGEALKKVITENGINTD